MQRVKTASIFAVGVMFLVACGSAKPTNEPTRIPPTDAVFVSSTSIPIATAMPSSTVPAPKATPDISPTVPITTGEQLKTPDWHEVGSVDAAQKVLTELQKYGLKITPQFSTTSALTDTTGQPAWTAIWGSADPANARYRFRNDPKQRQAVIDGMAAMRMALGSWTPRNQSGYSPGIPTDVDIVCSGSLIVPNAWKDSQAWEKIPNTKYILNLERPQDGPGTMFWKVGRKTVDGKLKDQLCAFMVVSPKSLDGSAGNDLNWVAAEQTWFDTTARIQLGKILSPAQAKAFQQAIEAESALPPPFLNR